MQIQRLFEIVYLLLDHKQMTAQELADHFEVSKRTILRDIDTLSQARIPLYTTPGRGGGIALMDHFVLNKTTIDETQQEQILFALQSMKISGDVEIQDTLRKLQTFFHKDATDWIEVDFSRWGHQKRDQALFQVLKQAILQKQALRFDYASSYGTMKARKVYPCKLTYKGNAWYLQAYCLKRKDYRSFRISRMRSCEAINAMFFEEILDPPAIESNMESMNVETIEARIDKVYAYRVFDDFDEEEIKQEEDGSFHVSVQLPNDDWLYGFLLTYGPYLQILKPQHVKVELLKRIEEIKRINS